MDTQIIGVATCDHCRSRFRIQARHAKLEGKAIRCPRCHREFVMKIERPSIVEQAAIQNSEEQPREKKQKSKSETRTAAIRKIKEGMRAYHQRLQQIAAQESSSEEEVRRWCIDVLRHVLGYKDIEIDTEMRALNQRIDIALKREEKVFLVVECKNVRSKLPTSVRDQAVMYAVNKSADWAVVTSGQVWKLYRVFPMKGSDPHVVEVFDLALLDEDGVSEEDAEKLYLLTSRALFSGDSEKMYHRIACLSAQRVLTAITSPLVLTAIRRSLTKSYKAETSKFVGLDDDLVVERLKSLFLPSEL